jgi:hypothetical protein
LDNALVDVIIDAALSEDGNLGKIIISDRNVVKVGITLSSDIRQSNVWEWDGASVDALE